MTFQAWKIPFLNSMTFHDFQGCMGTPMLLTNKPEHELLWSCLSASQGFYHGAAAVRLGLVDDEDARHRW